MAYIEDARTPCRGSKPDSRVGVGMERQGPSYGEVVSTKDVRVQALLGRSNSPTSRRPGGGRVDYECMNYKVPNPSACGGGWLI